MACCPMVASHCLDQCWFIISEASLDHNELISFNQKQLNYVIRYYRSTHCSVFSYINCMILMIFLHCIYQLIWFVNCWQWHDVCSMILTSIIYISVFPLTHKRCEVVISWWSPLLPKISIYATKCESILEKSGIFIHLQWKYCINFGCKKNLTISWVQIAARWQFWQNSARWSTEVVRWPTSLII